jgi:hypothetical protein
MKLTVVTIIAELLAFFMLIAAGILGLIGLYAAVVDDVFGGMGGVWAIIASASTAWSGLVLWLLVLIVDRLDARG